jgi:1-acyl-sn-glycerol-3-phosphate acyltransferase
VLPCYLDGTFRAWPKGRRLPRPRKVRLIIGPPRHFAGEENADAVAKELHTAVAGLGENHGSA